jgi:hypothetical protein
MSRSLSELDIERLLAESAGDWQARQPAAREIDPSIFRPEASRWRTFAVVAASTALLLVVAAFSLAYLSPAPPRTSSAGDTGGSEATLEPQQSPLGPLPAFGGRTPGQADSSPPTFPCDGCAPQPGSVVTALGQLVDYGGGEIVVCRLNPGVSRTPVCHGPSVPVVDLDGDNVGPWSEIDHVRFTMAGIVSGIWNGVAIEFQDFTPVQRT